MPVHRRRLGQFVGEVDGDEVAFAQLDGRAGHRAVVGPGFGRLCRAAARDASATAVRLSSTTPGLAEVFCRTGGETQLSGV